MSEKSICESGIGFTFPPARWPRTDDPDRFLFMFRPPYRIHDKQQPLAHRLAKSLEPPFLARMCYIVPVESVGISKDCRRLFKRDAMFLEVGDGLRNVPRKHIFVYTLIRPQSQD